VRFLFEAECSKNPEIEHFYLWVFEENQRAIHLYQRMKFVSTGMSQRLNLVGRTEIKYQLTLDTAVVKATETAVNEATRRKDQEDFGVTYRVLGA
jgi:ribosomal protein S18 acetylase RimI-like enzyme